MKKSIFNLSFIVSLVLIFASCSHEENVFQIEQSNSINFDAINEVQSTRGTPLFKGDIIQNMAVYAYNTGEGLNNTWQYKKNIASPNLMKNSLVVHDGVEYISTEGAEWPKNGNDNVSFFAYSPAATAENGITIKSDHQGLPVFNYTVPRRCSDQPDLMVSLLKKDLTRSKNGDQSVDFSYKHTLTCINFKGKGVGKITRIFVRGIKTSADLVVNDNGTFQWTNLSGTGDFEAIIDKKVLTSDYQELTRRNGYFMMIPQTLPAHSKIIVVVESGDIIYLDVSNHVWKAGQVVSYNLDVTDYTMIEDYTIDSPYVGAFWKANQTGERIIRMEVECSTKTFREGEWKVEVMNNGGFAEGDIVFSKIKSADNGITYSADNERPADMNTNDGIFRVSSNATSVTQAMKDCLLENGKRYIYFRIGLKSTYAPTAQAPVRYALVKLSYGHLDIEGRNKTIYLFLRQGEYPDNLFSERNLSKQITPYNLSASASSYYVSTRGAVGTNYPTQAGRFFKWMQTKQGEWMQVYMPYGPGGTWSQNVIDQFWGYAYNLYKVAPTNFRRPREGQYKDSYGYWQPGNIYGSIFTISTYGALDESFDVTQDINKDYSELAQSLFYDFNELTGNSTFGYYADGFFDRHAISNNAVKSNTINVGYAGRLFFNPTTLASIFFPATGYRHGQTGAIIGAGKVTRLWTSAGFKVNNGGSYYSPTYMYRAVALEIGQSGISFQLPYRSEAASIRCVYGNEED